LITITVGRMVEIGLGKGQRGLEPVEIEFRGSAGRSGCRARPSCISPLFGGLELGHVGHGADQAHDFSVRGNDRPWP